MPRQASALERHRARALQFRKLGEEAERDRREKRAQLQHRIERKALEHRVLVEAIELEKELEARRCKLCDLLRAEAWGLGHRDWQERRCGQCWKEYANTLAQQRHEASPARPQRLNAPTAAAPAAGGSHLDMHGAGVVSDLLLPLLGQAVAEGRVDLEDVLAAARARDGERLAELMDHRALERHLDRATLAGGASAQPQRPVGERGGERPPEAHAAPHPEQPRGSYYYHDAVLQPLGGAPASAEGGPADSGGQGAASEGGAASVASSAVADAGGMVEESQHGSPEAPRRGSWRGQHGRRASEAHARMSSGTGGSQHGGQQRHTSTGRLQDRRAGAHVAGGDSDGGEGRRRGASGGSFGGSEEGGSEGYVSDVSLARGIHGTAATHGSGLRRQHGSSDGEPSVVHISELQPPEARLRPMGQDGGGRGSGAAGHGGHVSVSRGEAAGVRRGGAGQGLLPGEAVGGRCGEWRKLPPGASTGAGGREGTRERAAEARGVPLPSKPRRLPTCEADMEAALREAEQLVVFGSSQRQRSEALFYSHQLRAALADLRLLDRRTRRLQQAGVAAGAGGGVGAGAAAGAARTTGLRAATGAKAGRAGAAPAAAEGSGGQRAAAAAGPRGRPSEGWKGSGSDARKGGAAMGSDRGRLLEVAGARIIQEGRADPGLQSPDALRPYTHPDAAYVDPPRHGPQHLQHVHPDDVYPLPKPSGQHRWPSPSAARPSSTTHTRDPPQAGAAPAPAPWRPASAHPPVPPHPPGWQSVGDWDGYRYEWDLANVRALPVNDYLTNRRKEKEYRAALASLQARAWLLSGVTPEAAGAADGAADTAGVELA